MTENPAHKLASVYGNRWLSIGCENDEEEEYINLHIVIDTRRLSFDEEGDLVENLENLKVFYEYDDYEAEFRVKVYDILKYRDEEHACGKVIVSGRVPEYNLDKVYDILDEYDVDYE